MLHFILGAAILTGGIFWVLKSEALYNSFGAIGFFDKYLGTEGGSRLGYKLIGIAIVFIGFLVMTNMLGGFVRWVFSPIIEFQNGAGF
jgi:hypothetical protein